MKGGYIHAETVGVKKTYAYRIHPKRKAGRYRVKKRKYRAEAFQSDAGRSRLAGIVRCIARDAGRSLRHRITAIRGADGYSGLR